MAEKIGVLGLGSLSTLFYLEQLNAVFNKKLGGYSTFPLLLYNIDFNTINPFLPENFDVLENVISKYLQEIEQLGIDFLLIPNITLHRTIDRLNLNLTIAHPVELTVQHLKENQISEVTIFATKSTSDSVYMKEKFSDQGISLEKPNSETIEFLDKFRKEVYFGTQTKESLEKFKNLLKNYNEKSTVIIACTELSIALQQLKLPAIDMAMLQIFETLRQF